ncbi:MAG: hypothetical protein ABI345_01270 [Jatrophihabitans sp.]
MDDTRLGAIDLGLGAPNGYAPGDLTNPRAAVAAGEVPYLAVDGSTPDADPVLELRIHGIGGAPAATNLQTPQTVQVGGDATAGFFRPWFPGGRAAGQPRREAYCWGGLTTRASSRALWLLLVSFMLVNVAHWALPAPGTRRQHAARSLSRAILRLLGLALTLAFTATAVTLVADLLAWQGAGRGVLPSWLGWFARRDPGSRLAIALLVVSVGLAGLVTACVRTSKSYESWGTSAASDNDPAWTLTHPAFWRGERVVNRQRNLHVAASSALVLVFAALPQGKAEVARVVLLVLAGLIGVTAVGLIVSPWADRSNVAGMAERWSDVASRWFAIGAAALTLGASTSRFWWDVDVRTQALPGDQLVQTIIVLTEVGLLIALILAVVAQSPWRAGREVMVFGMTAPLLAGLACVIGTIFSASLILAVANTLGTPQVTVSTADVGGETLLLPSTVYVGGVGLIGALIVVVLVAIYAVAWERFERDRLARTDHGRDSDCVIDAYPVRGGPESIRAVADTWARSSLTDHAAAGLAVVIVPTIVAMVAYLICLQSGVESGFLGKVAAIGGTAGVAATVFFLAKLRSALVNVSTRKRLGSLWDIGTFWPRACHPFAPPCYAERSVPEVVSRIRRVVGDVVRAVDDPAHGQDVTGAGGQSYEAHSPVLLTGYSQGTPMSVAVLAQLPAEVRRHVSLLLLAAPVRRLYGRSFPAYFGPEALRRLRIDLTDHGDAVRWRTLVRRSDFVGGPAFDARSNPDDHHAVDRLILDPPVLWPDSDPSPPPTHRHSNFFSDPQITASAREMAGLLDLDAFRRGVQSDRAQQLPTAGESNEFSAGDGEQQDEQSQEQVGHGAQVPGR